MWDGVPLRDASLSLGAVVLAVLGGVLTVQTGHDWWLGLTVPLVVGYLLRWLVEDSPEMTRRAAVRKAWTRDARPS